MKKLLEVIEKLFYGIKDNATISIFALERDLKAKNVEIPKDKKEEIDKKSFVENRQSTSAYGGTFDVKVLEKSKIMDILKK